MNRTERDIIQALWSLLGEKPYNKITVQDIVNRCGVNRNTFYYHFQDIPSLTEESIRIWTDSVIQANRLPESAAQCVELMFQSCIKVKPILMNLYRSAQREYFQQGLFRIAGHLAQRYIEIVTQGYVVPGEDRAALTDFYRCTMTGAFLEWMESGMSEDGLFRAKRVCDFLDGIGKRALLKNAAPASPEP